MSVHALSASSSSSSWKFRPPTGRWRFSAVLLAMVTVGDDVGLWTTVETRAVEKASVGFVNRATVAAIVSHEMGRPCMPIMMRRLD
mmetsp:Transcript_38488/g.92737  ORF Transcript_38488/g.92737 Transcript_38488/m.92737 type:complete len:86 (+) Transcript_38488:761-1018(+)